MNITVKNEYRVEAEVTADETEELGIHFDELDYSVPETRMFLWHIIEEIRCEGIDIDMSGKVLIEAYDNGTGGCVIAFTVLPRGNGGCVKQLVKNVSSGVLVPSDSLDGLIGFSRSVGDVRSELYLINNAYELYVFPERDEREKVSRSLPEFFGVSSGAVPVRLAFCREHGKLLRADDAVHMLARL